MSDHDTTIELPITGMTCASCVARNETRLRKVAGVDKADVNLATEKATVTFDPGVVSAGELVAGRRRRGLRRRDRAGDAADHRHDLRELREPGGERAAQARRRPQGRRQPGHREGDRHVHARPGELRATSWRPCAAPATTSSSRRPARGEDGASRRRRTPKTPARARRLPQAQAQGHRRLRAQRRHLRRHDAARLVHRSCPTGCTTATSCGRWRRRCSSGWAGSSTPPPGRRCATARRP